MAKSEAKRITFTKRALEALLPPTDGSDRAYVHDTKVPGLCLAITASGGKSFYLYRWQNGRPVRLRIGSFPEVTVEIARTRATEWLGDMAKGVDVSAKKRAARGELTLSHAWDHWKAVRSTKRSFSIDERVWDHHLKRFATRPLSKITRAEIVALHQRIGRDRGACSANRMVALLRAMINLAIDDLAWSGANPCVRIRKHPEPARERFVQPGEMPALFQAIAAEPCETSRDFVLLLLLTGQRKSTVLRMRWQEVDLLNRVWHIPAESQKNGRPLSVPLDDSVVEILSRRSQDRRGNEWVLPSPADPKKPLRQPRWLWDRIRERSGLKDIRPHDLRRTFASYLAMSGAGLAIVGAALGHRSVASTMVYNRLTTNSVRDAASKGIDAMRVASGGLLVAPVSQDPQARDSDGTA
ncbi:MAG: tyrosine-type recombinase/integrase [Planctomycetaceae bacterium]|nr:tyrosine-type recombinase/integrase [Planctomycetaceae bacterium]